MIKNKVKFNPFSAEFRANPYPTYDRLRVEDPIHWSFLKAWVVTRHRDVKQILSDRRFIADDLPERLNQKKLYLQEGEDFNLLKQTISKWLFFVEPPLHNRLREIMTKAFSVSTIEQMRPQVTEIVNELINDVREAGEMDIITDMAAPLPALVTAKTVRNSTARQSFNYPMGLRFISGI